MPDLTGRKTEVAHWDSAWESPVRRRIPSRLDVGIFNITGLLRKHVRPGDRYMGVGCAPGKLLAWVSCRCQARASGLDYSETGIRQCRALFSALGLDIDLYQEDLFKTAVPESSFDVVASFGLIEHFDDPRGVVTRHLDLLRPGGTALIGVPNYGGIYGRLQGSCNPANLALHNLKIMSPEALAALVEDQRVGDVRAYRYGHASLGLVQLEKKLPRRLAKGIQILVNGIGLLQFFPVRGLAPMLVLEIHK